MKELILLRKHLHAHPELSGKEFQTRITISSFLSKYGINHQVELGDSGLAAVIEGELPGKTVLLRADIDALPIQEVNEFQHKSKVSGVSHMCGHDGHTAMLAGAGIRLQEEPPKNGKVILLFQPAEETGQGARQILEDKAFQQFNPDLVFALHNLPGYPKKQVIWRKNVFTAAVSSMIIRLNGKTAHAAEPEKGTNPAFAIGELLRELQSLSLNDPSSQNFQLVTPVYMNLGTKAYGTSAGKGEVHLTIRAWEMSKVQQLIEQIQRITQQIAQKQGLSFEYELLETFHNTLNHPEALKWIRNAASRLNLSQTERSIAFKWGEDFGLFTSRFPGAMFGLGAGVETPALHNPDYDFPDDILETGSNMFEYITRLALEN